MSETDKPIVCPMQWSEKYHGLDLCLPATYPGRGHRCAWWIPGAECCAIVLIAQRLSEMAAVQYLSKRLEDVR